MTILAKKKNLLKYLNIAQFFGTGVLLFFIYFFLKSNFYGVFAVFSVYFSWLNF